MMGYPAGVSQPLRVQPFVVFLPPSSDHSLLPPESVVVPRPGGGPLLHHLAKFPVGRAAILVGWPIGHHLSCASLWPS